LITNNADFKSGDKVTTHKTFSEECLCFKSQRDADAMAKHSAEML
jgi:hypothetical protein